MTIEYKDSKRIVALSTDFQPTVTTPATYQVTDTSGGETLSGSLRTTSAEAIKSGSVLIGKTVSKVEFPMYKLSSPTGTVTAGVFNSSGSLLYTFGTMEAADISTSTSPFTWYAFENTVSTYTLSEGEYVGVRYSGGNSTNRVVPRHDDVSPPFDGTNSVWSRGYDNGNWQDFTAIDASFKLYLATDGSKPINVQDNSILVEKNTARRYWFDDEFSKSNCKAYFTLDETSGNPANHATSANGFSDGNGINGTNGSTGATQNVTGKFDKCFDFTGGNNEQVDMGNTILSGTTDFTMACWINSEVTTSGAYMLFNSYASGYTGGVQFYINGADRKLYYWSSSGDFAGSTAISGTDGAWDFAVVTRSGTTMTIYLNGSVDGTSTVSHSIAGTNMTLGGSSGASGYVFNGKIDEASIWTRALSASEISELYNSGTGKTLLEAKTATWTMQPTFQDDFSSDNWTDSGTNPQVTGGEMVWSVNSAVDANSYYDLGSPISNNSWVLRCKITINNYTLNTDGTGQEFSFGLSNETTIPTNSKDAIVFRLRTGSSTAQYQLIDVDGGSLSGGAASQAFTRTLSAETIYVELIRTSTTTYKANIYSDSAYNVLLESQTTTCPSTITNLQYINFYSLENDGTSNGVLDGICDDIEFYNGVTSVN